MNSDSEKQSGVQETHTQILDPSLHGHEGWKCHFLDPLPPLLHLEKGFNDNNSRFPELLEDSI